MKPILFNTEMVRAILDGRKTVTRRVIKQSTNKTFDPFWECYTNDNGKVVLLKAPYRPGDILYVRETWTEETGRYFYRADYESDLLSSCETLSGGYPASCAYHPGCEGCTREDYRIRWHPSIHMPKDAARIFLRVTDVRVEQLKEIGNCIKEGIAPATHATAHMNEIDERCAFAHLWDSTIKPAYLDLYGWDANPFCWVITFERISKDEAMQ